MEPFLDILYDEISWERNRYNQDVAKTMPIQVCNVEDEQTALDFANANLPPDDGNMRLESIQIERKIGDDVFQLTAHYKNGEEREPQYTFSTSGGTTRRMTSLATVARVPAGEPYPGGINVDETGRVQGVEVVTPVYSFAETHTLKAAMVTTAYKKRLAQLTGTVNARAFRGFDAGEVLFLGAEGSRNGDNLGDDWQIGFRFSVSNNAKNIRIGTLVVPEKYGWDCLWVRFGKSTAGGKLISVPKAVFVERVYEMTDFGELGIGN